MIKTSLYEQVLFDTIKRGATELSPDVEMAFEQAILREKNEDARAGLEATLKSMRLSGERKNPLCVDTGWPIFYFKVGNRCVLEGGFVELENAARRAVARATELGYLRATMKHPLTGYDPGNNVGMNIPDFTYRFVEGDGIEVSYAAKGGGSECFGGTRHRVIAFADGVKGIEKFVLDSFVASTRAGAVCPPSVLGIGIGGTANVAANLAKEAACLRSVGSRHPDPMFAKIEEDLYEALNSLGIGMLGGGGSTSVLAVNVEYAYTHIAGIACATSTNCMVARRASSRIEADGSVSRLKSPLWFGDR
ncbi:MAG: fumarate hydratase [Clostridia bacterium]|nr:fumarate hydratase [Clostridia bacterium]MBO5754852.1 fumarate hydratase [Clostridia bacterium]MBO7170432.1 fumarate hydratase [Clostridia bacterium]